MTYRCRSVLPTSCQSVSHTTPVGGSRSDAALSLLACSVHPTKASWGPSRCTTQGLQPFQLVRSVAHHGQAVRQLLISTVSECWKGCMLKSSGTPVSNWRQQGAICRKCERQRLNVCSPDRRPPYARCGSKSQDRAALVRPGVGLGVALADSDSQ